MAKTNSDNTDTKFLDKVAIVISLFGLVMSCFAFYTTYSFEGPQQRPYVTTEAVRVDNSIIQKEISGDLVFLFKNTGKAPLVIESLSIQARPNTSVIAPGMQPAVVNPIASSDNFSYSVPFQSPIESIGKKVVVLVEIKYRNALYIGDLFHNKVYVQTFYFGYNFGNQYAHHATRSDIYATFMDKGDFAQSFMGQIR